MDKEIKFPDHPCRYCLKRPTCTICCLDYYILAHSLKGVGYSHLLKHPGDSTLYDYLTMYGIKTPQRNLDAMPEDSRELERWVNEWIIK